MKLKTRKYVIIAIIILSYFLMTGIDYTLSKLDSRPIFAIPITRYKDGGSVKYLGLGYTVIKYDTLDGRHDAQFKFLFTK